MFALPIHVDLLEEWEAGFKAVPGTNVLESVHEFIGGASWLLLSWRNRLIHAKVFIFKILKYT